LSFDSTTQAGLRYHSHTFDHDRVREIVCEFAGCRKSYTTHAGLRYHRKTMHPEAVAAYTAAVREATLKRTSKSFKSPKTSRAVVNKPETVV